MLCRLRSFHTLAVTSALSPRQPVQTSHFSPYLVALEPLFSHRGVTATSQIASRWLLCCPTNGPFHLVDVTFTFTFTYFYPPQNWPHLYISTNSLFLSLISMKPLGLFVIFLPYWCHFHFQVNAPHICIYSANYAHHANFAWLDFCCTIQISRLSSLFTPFSLWDRSHVYLTHSSANFLLF